MARLIAMLAVALCACATPRAGARAWQSPLLTDHPLVGRIWDVRAGRWTTEAALVRDLARAPVVLLGEKHDNPDHHRLQALLVRRLIEAGRHPALAFEMIETDRQAAVDAVLARPAPDPDEIARALDWAHSGWPAFSFYRPVFAAGLAAHLAILGANLPHDRARGLVIHGLTVLEDGLVRRLHLDRPADPATLAALKAELREAHCGQLPEEMMDGMALAQRARDAQMAERLSGHPEGAVLIAGSGHVRRDRGVPTWLGEEARVVSFEEVTIDEDDPSGYAGRYGTSRLPFDYVWFTPAESDDDPCAELSRPHRRR